MCFLFTFPGFNSVSQIIVYFYPCFAYKFSYLLITYVAIFQFVFLPNQWSKTMLKCSLWIFLWSPSRKTFLIFYLQAVSIMKNARQLDLIVRKSAGCELFPGESSGYNSSASSVTGDQSPSWSDSKRLSIVKEESLDLEDRLSHLKSKTWEKIDWDEERDDRSYHFKPTIINLSENGTTIKDNNCQRDKEAESHAGGKSKQNKIADICLVSRQHETKTVIVEVHRSDVEEDKNDKKLVVKSPSISSFNSFTSRASDTSSSLSSAIYEELQRRAAVSWIITYLGKRNDSTVFQKILS